MHTEPREAPNLEHNYEVRDINSRAIWMATLYFFGFIGFSIVAGALIYRAMNPGLTRDEAAIAAHRDQLPKNVPALQSNMKAKTDLYVLRQAEDKKLVGEEQNEDGTYSIPIEAAMKMVVESGAKTPAAAPKQDATIDLGAKPQAATSTAPEVQVTPPAGAGGNP
jgi:hypothetical protein